MAPASFREVPVRAAVLKHVSRTRHCIHSSPQTCGKLRCQCAQACRRVMPRRYAAGCGRARRRARPGNGCGDPASARPGNASEVCRPGRCSSVREMARIGNIRSVVRARLSTCSRCRESHPPGSHGASAPGSRAGSGCSRLARITGHTGGTATAGRPRIRPRPVSRLPSRHSTSRPVTAGSPVQGRSAD